jgi:hypothetical protein
MKVFRWLTAFFMLSACGAWSQQQVPANDASQAAREWTNLDGRKIKAQFLGVQGSNVALKLQNGKISFVPSNSLSAEDNAFLRDHRYEYRAQWQAWPQDASIAIKYPEVKEEAGKNGEFVYTTPHFRFHSNVDLGAVLMKDLAREFELTLHLHSKSPFGILSKPEKDLFEAKLFGTLDSYTKAGGPPGTAGVYLIKERVFLAPLELMGMKPGSAGWRKISENFDLSTIVHELTHMLTHDMLANLPTWANEGYAEYISNIPSKSKAFQTDNESIREGVRDMFVREYLKARTPKGAKIPDMGKADRIKHLKNTGADLYKVAKVLRMGDLEWATGTAAVPAGPGATPAGRGPSPFSSGTDHNRLPRLYRTAHLIFYYFIQIEGEKGVMKIRRFLDANRAKLADYNQYLEAYRNFEKELAAFMNLPGVSKLPDGRIRYPSDLKPPAEPKAPFTDPDSLKLGGLEALLEGESAEAVGERIEKALIQDLDVNLRFKEAPTN